MYQLDPHRTDLAEAFKANPSGPHDGELLKLLDCMRSGPMAGKYVAVCTKRHREWVLGRLPGVRGEPVELLEDRVFDSFAAVEWAVFELRWEDLGGEPLDLGR